MKRGLTVFPAFLLDLELLFHLCNLRSIKLPQQTCISSSVNREAQLIMGPLVAPGFLRQDVIV